LDYEERIDVNEAANLQLDFCVREQLQNTP
jgi:hypothetical protein